MSAGVFEISQYSSNTLATVHRIRVQPETLAATLGGTANAAPSGTAVLPSAQVSKSKRSLGINARTITIKFAAGDEPDGYKPDSPITIPWLQNNSAFLTAVPGITATTYLGESAILVGTSAEKVN
jgi:hypothetical protein